MTQKIAVISDTHNNQKLFRSGLQQEAKLDYIFHLGDYYSDLDENIDLLHNRRLVKVPGIFHPGYQDQSLQRTKSIELEGWKFLLVHDINDSIAERADHDLILYGHTHHAAFYQKNSKYYLNPGHLKNLSDRGAEASYCLITASADALEIVFKNLQNQIIQQYNIIRKKLEDK
ncbi:MAG: metallophosphoesterase family protein [Candidatus Cloacimonadales bacterium]